jgi:excisionase family DNA binding protein
MTGRPKGSKDRPKDPKDERRPTSDAPVMTVSEICDYLRIVKSTLYHMIKRGEIPYFNVGSDYRFNREAIDAWTKRGN